MGLLDRFKKEPGPDALTLEAVARVRVMPGVASADAVDADTVTVTWAAHPGTTTVSLAAVREQWAKASGFARIEIMDEALAGVAPPDPDAAPPAPRSPEVPPVEAVTPEAAPPEPTAPGDDAAWIAARPRLRVIVGRRGGDPQAVAWPVASVLEARVVLGGPGAMAVDSGDVASWGVTADDVRDAALANLAADDPGLDPVGPGQPAWVPTSPADHPPVWLAAPERLLAATGLPEAIALAPMPSELVIVDPSAHDLLGSVLVSTKGILAGESRILWPAPLLVTVDGVAPWEPAPDHPCAAAAAELSAS